MKSTDNSAPTPADVVAQRMTDEVATGKRYLVNEIFYSLQGEGYFTGSASVFLRMSGCNRHCEFCDTDFSAATPMTESEIVAEMARFPARRAVVTGGEPLMQLDPQLIDALHRAGFTIAIETNGTLPVPDGVDWVVCSPKRPPLHIDRIDELKIVFTPDCDPEAVAATLPTPQHYYLQPMSGLNTADVVAYILAHPRWRLSLQTHKLIDIQ